MKKPLEVTHRYDDIIDLPHHTSPTRPRMPLRDRAAQFAPFAALVGHGAAIRETARLTDSRVDLTEDEKAILDGRLRMILEMADKRPEVSICYFEPDAKKAGGAYVMVISSVKKFDEISKILILEDGAITPELEHRKSGYVERKRRPYQGNVARIA